MVTIESTAAMASHIYETMAHNLKIIRTRLDKPLTLADKILLGHLAEPHTQALEPGSSYLFLKPDRVILQDVLGQTAMLQFMQTRREQVDVPTTIHCDHLIQARVDGVSDLRESLAENQEVYDFLKSAAARYGVGFWEPGAGIIHQVNLESYAFPGQLIIGTDSHTTNAGGLGSCAVGVGGADAVEAMAGLPWEVLYPKSIAVYLTGELNGWTAPKDIILYVAGQLTVSGATNAIVEYIGPGAHTLSATGKTTITNMGAEMGATTSIFPYDAHMATYLQATGRAELVPPAASYAHLLAPDAEVEDDPDSHYDTGIRLDLSSLEPHVIGPHSPDRARPISQLAAEVADAGNEFVDAISTALIGSCTNSSYEDMSRAADVAQQAQAHGLHTAVPLMVTPGSERVRATIERDGQMAVLKAVGATVLANACGPCIGQWRRAATETEHPNTIVTSYNRNFPRRNDGQPTTMNFIASPEMVTALAIAGKLSFNPLTDSLTGTDGQPFKLHPPKPALEVPSQSFAAGHAAYIAPPAHGEQTAIQVSPDSERLQLMTPWPAWDGQDFLDMPVLMKTRGKTTTDHISPAGSWLRFRGHLDKFSDNLLMGATNTFTQETGTGNNVLSGASGQTISSLARDYQANHIKWVIGGDDNYGEGSSREHAALSPRLLGGAAVIARSFARIHESNLKKQGLLALTFQSPDDYDRIREDDRISLVGLAQMAPGQPVICRLSHADGTLDTLELRHSFSTFNTLQLEWFRRGSALNVLHD